MKKLSFKIKVVSKNLSGGGPETYIFSLMLESCLILSVTYYAQNYAGIIDWSIVYRQCLYPVF